MARVLQKRFNPAGLKHKGRGVLRTGYPQHRRSAPQLKLCPIYVAVHRAFQEMRHGN